MREKMTLLPCPFCGSAAGEGLHGIPAVECSNKDCGASLHRYHREEAYVLWNMRHLTQPAQAVDVGAKVADAWRDAAAACLGKHSRLFRYVCEEADKLTAALPKGCQHEWEQVTERGKFCVHCGQIITHATFEYVPPQEDTPDAAR